MTAAVRSCVERVTAGDMLDAGGGVWRKNIVI